VVRDADPLLRAAALRALEAQAPQDWRTTIVPRLGDPVRLVRTEAARMLASVPAAELSLEQQKARHRGLEEMRQGLEAQSDQAGALLMLGVLAEQQGMAAAAEASYRAAIAVQPQVTGPRSNLAALLERQGDATQVARLRAEELDLLARDARLAPRHAATQYRYALSLYLNGRVAEAVPVLQQACTLEPNNADFHLMLALLLEHNRRWDEALAALDQLERIRPADPGAAEVRARIEAQRKNQPTTAP
jgi:Flp pilus assembly protein TadD